VAKYLIHVKVLVHCKVQGTKYNGSWLSNDPATVNEVRNVDTVLSLRYSANFRYQQIRVRIKVLLIVSTWLMARLKVWCSKRIFDSESNFGINTLYGAGYEGQSIGS
jgi:hypothetical protein